MNNNYSIDEEKLKNAVNLLTPLYKFVEKYHDYSVEGFGDSFSSDKNYIFAVNHSLATYDMILFAGYLYFSKGIWPRVTVDNFILKNPFLNKLFGFFQPIPPDFQTMEKILKRNESILIAPGGMKEAVLRSESEKNKVIWENRKGFIKLSLKTGVPIYLAANPHSDDVYDIKKNIVTDFFYHKFKVPLPIAKGKTAWLPFLPKKIKLTHYVEGPFYPPEYGDEDDFDLKTDEFHKFICDKMNQLLAEKYSNGLSQSE